MRTALNFKAKTGAFKSPSVPPFPVVPWRCPTLSCCHSVLFNTPHTRHSCSGMSGTNDCVLFSRGKSTVMRNGSGALCLNGISLKACACSRSYVCVFTHTHTLKKVNKNCLSFHSFSLTSCSKLQTHFQWECTAPFHLSTAQGLLKPNQECHIMVVFKPQEALVYQGQACCFFGEEKEKAQSSCSVLLQGLGIFKSY